MKVMGLLKRIVQAIVLSLWVAITAITLTYLLVFTTTNYTINDMNSFSSKEYNKLITHLYTAKSKAAVINIEVRSNGGYVIGGKVIINALIDTKATTSITVHDYAQSMAAILLCYSDTLIVSPDTLIMYHLPRYTDREGVVTIYTDKTNKHFKAFEKLFTPCKKYLTEAQLQAYYKGEDVYVHPYQFWRFSNE